MGLDRARGVPCFSMPALVAWWVGRHVLGLNAAALMGAIAGARQNTSSMQSAQEQTESAMNSVFPTMHH
jgi:uncharacterized transporter YbjL